MNKRSWVRIALLSPAAIVAPVYAADYLSIPQAQELLFPDAGTFKEHTVLLTASQKKQIKSISGMSQRWDQQRVWRVEKAGGFLGWFIVDEVIGKHEFITYAAALSADGKVIGVEILSYRETHGGEVRDAEWRGHFKGKSLSDPFKLGVDIPNISGATLSCRNITDGVKRLLALHQIILAHESGD